MKNFMGKFIAALTMVIFLAATAWSQTTAFTYQGRLTDGGTPANGNYDLQFALFDSASGGAQIGTTQTVNTVAVMSGIFSVTLDFGVSAFPGANRFLEINARLSGAPSFTTLSPRQQITATPYAIRSLNAASADSVPVNALPAGNGNYVQNTTAQQANTNFNISGNGVIGGNLGVGTGSPTARFEIFNTSGDGFALTNGTARLRANFSGNTPFFGTSTNHSFGLHANGGANGGLFLENTGKIGIGTIFPNHKLTIDTLSGPTWTNDGWGGAIALRNSSAIGWQFNSSSRSFGIGQSTGGLSFFRTTNSPGTSGNTPTYDVVITNAGDVGIGTPLPNAKLFVEGEAATGVGIAATGNASQSRNKGGWVKAMIHIDSDGSILRCYNGLTGSSINPCGFSVVTLGGFFSVNFGFQVNDRFVFPVAGCGINSGVQDSNPNVYDVRPNCTSSVTISVF